MSFSLQRVELMGLLFWVMSLLFVKRGRPALIVLGHLVGAGLSLAIPLLVASNARHVPFATLVSVCFFGVLNGLLGAAWCGRVDPPISKLPMLGFTAAGLGGALFLAIMAATPTRLF